MDMTVNGDVCTSTPRRPNAIELSCGMMNDLPIVNVSWALPDEGT